MKEGIIPVVAGTITAIAGGVLKGSMEKEHSMNAKNITPIVGAGLVGFGLAHIALGAIDYVQHR